jgi:hypothetical protein
MNRCLHCNKPCATPAIFCDSCRDSLLVRHPSVTKSDQTPAPTAEQNYDTEAAISSSTPTAKSVRSRRIPPRVRFMLIIFAIVAVLSFTADGIMLVAYSLRHHPLSSHTLANDSTTTPTALTTSIVSTHGSPTVPGTSTSQQIHATPGTGKQSASAGLVLSTSHLTFQYVQGGALPASQSVVLQSSNASAFSWQTSEGAPASWLTVAPMQGAAAQAMNGLIVVQVQNSHLAVGVYTSTISISGTNAAGKPLQNSPQALTATLIVQPPCNVQAAPADFAFTATLLQPNPQGQTLSLKATGSCPIPVSWTANVDASWVQLSSSSGSDTGAGSSIIVTIHASSLLIGTYTAHITLAAIDTNGAAVQVSPQTITVTLHMEA